MLRSKVLILQHAPLENGGTLESFLKEAAVSFQRIRLYGNDKLPPSLQGVEAVVSLGGPMNVYEEERYPFLKEEDRFVKKLVKKKIPFLGICLGGQILAKALGAKVSKAFRAEVGWGEVEISQEGKRDNLLGPLNLQRLRIVQWHEDQFKLPKGAKQICSGLSTPCQAFSYAKAYGFQFHLEVDEPLLRSWFVHHPRYREIMQVYHQNYSELRRISRQVYQRFFSSLLLSRS